MSIQLGDLTLVHLHLEIIHRWLGPNGSNGLPPGVFFSVNRLCQCAEIFSVLN